MVVTLTGSPMGRIRTRADAELIVEVVELLADVGELSSASDLFQDRTAFQTWLDLPAIRSGLRATAVFVASPARRELGTTLLGLVKICDYLNAAGMFAALSGDLKQAVSTSTNPSASCGTPTHPKLPFPC